MLLARIVCLLAFLGFGLGGGRAAQAQPTAAASLFTFKRASQKSGRVRTQLQRNLLVVEVFLNGTGPYNFLLDTGVGISIVTDPAVAQALRLRRGERYRVVGAGGVDTGLQAFRTDSVRLELAGVVAPLFSLLVLSDDVLNLSGYMGVPIHGILGSELFRSFVVALHPEHSSMTLTAPAAYRAPRGRRWSSLPLSLEKNKAYFTAQVQLTDSLTLPVKLVLDTGASHALSLELDSDPRLVGPTRRLVTDLGQGLTGTVRGYLGRVPTLRLGRYTLRTVLASFPNSADVHGRVDVPRNGNVGYELLKRFSLVIDYPHQRLLLRPNTSYSEAFEHDMCGLDLLATGPDLRRYQVLRVEPDSPAAVAGLQVNDELISINFLPANAFSLTQLGRMMHSQDGRVLFVVVRRSNGDLHSAPVRLKRQI